MTRVAIVEVDSYDDTNGASQVAPASVVHGAVAARQAGVSAAAADNGTVSDAQLSMWAACIRASTSGTDGHPLAVVVVLTDAARFTEDEIYAQLGAQRGTFTHVAASRCGRYVLFEGTLGPLAIV